MCINLLSCAIGMIGDCETQQMSGQFEARWNRWFLSICLVKNIKFS